MGLELEKNEAKHITLIAIYCLKHVCGEDSSENFQVAMSLVFHA